MAIFIAPKIIVLPINGWVNNYAQNNKPGMIVFLNAVFMRRKKCRAKS